MSETPYQVFERMGELVVRDALSNGMIVQHLVKHAYDWLTNLDAKRQEASNAATQGQIGQDAIGEYPRDDQRGPSGETGGSGGVSPTTIGEGSADAGHAR